MRAANSSAAFDVGDELRLRRFEADLAHGVFEQQAVFGLLDGVDLGADQLHAVLIEHAGFGQFHGKIQAGLAAHGGEQRIGPLAADDLFEIGRGQRLDVGLVGEIGVGHDGRRIGIDQDHFVAVGAQRLGGLGAGVIELAGLADDDGAGADDQDAVEVVAPGHRLLPVPAHQFHEIVEEVVRIVRTGRGFGVVLHAEHRVVAVAEAFERLVVEIDVGDFDVVEVERIGVHREAVIVRGDLDLLGDFVEHRMIGAAMSELQLVGLAAARPGPATDGPGRCRRWASCR